MNKRIIKIIMFLMVLGIFNYTTYAGTSISQVYVNISSFDLLNRTMHSNIYGENGNYTFVKLSSGPVNYKNGTIFMPINTTIINLGSGDFEYGVEKGVYKAYFKSESS